MTNKTDYIFGEACFCRNAKLTTWTFFSICKPFPLLLVEFRQYPSNVSCSNLFLNSFHRHTPIPQVLKMELINRERFFVLFSYQRFPVASGICKSLQMRVCARLCLNKSIFFSTIDFPDISKNNLTSDLLHELEVW